MIGSGRRTGRADRAGRHHPRRNVLFVCSRNQWRSPTAEEIFRREPRLSVRSRGTSPRARRTVSADDIAWADIILVMETKHRSRLAAMFTRLLEHKPLHVLDIPDDYRFMDPELVGMLKDAVEPLLESEGDTDRSPDP